jgi:hypothetical protein
MAAQAFRGTRSPAFSASQSPMTAYMCVDMFPDCGMAPGSTW